MNTQFEIGKTYATRSICDYDCIFSITIASRTEKTIKTTDGKTLRVNTKYSKFEQVKPFGTYSMATVIAADDLVN
jgi:hypothetical protein